MKKIVLILTVVITALAGCKEVEQPIVNQEENNQEEPSLLGTWELNSVIQENGSIKVNDFETATFSATSKDESGTFIFTEDSLSSSVGYTAIVKTTIAGQSSTQEQSVPVNTYTTAYTYNEANRTITTTQMGESMTYTIEKMTMDSLVLNFDFETSTTTGPITSVSSADASFIMTR